VWLVAAAVWANGPQLRRLGNDRRHRLGRGGARNEGFDWGCLVVGAGGMGAGGSSAAGLVTCTLGSAAGGLGNCTLGSAATGSEGVGGGVVACFKIWAIWMQALVTLEPQVRDGMVLSLS
jgi:hypothetical protein